MGVKKLRNLLDEDVIITNFGRETLPKQKQKHLLIDASSLLWQILDERPIPGDYLQFTERDHSGLTKIDVIRFFQAFGLELNRQLVGANPNSITNANQAEDSSASPTGTSYTWTTFCEEFLSPVEPPIDPDAIENFRKEFIQDIQRVRIFVSDNFIVIGYDETEEQVANLPVPEEGKEITKAETAPLSQPVKIVPKANNACSAAVLDLINRRIHGYILTWKQWKPLLEIEYKRLDDEMLPLPPIDVFLFERDIVKDKTRFEVLIEADIIEATQRRMLTVLHNGSDSDHVNRQNDREALRFGRSGGMGIEGEQSANLDGFGRALPIVETTDSGLWDRRYGGTYDEMIAILKQEIRNLQDMGFKLLFVFDSYDNSSKQAKLVSFKASTHRSRKQYKQVTWNELRDVIEKERRVFKQDKLPLPPLTEAYFTQYLLSHAKELAIDIDNDIGEADPKIHRHCMRLRQEYPDDNNAYFVYSYDTDFEVMPACPLIRLNCINPYTGDDTTINAIVWRRERTAQILGISEELYVEYCLILGSDYTNHLDPATLQYGSHIGLANMTQSELLQMMRHECKESIIYVKTIPGCLGNTLKEEIQDLHLQYSRAFYYGQSDVMTLLEDELQLLTVRLKQQEEIEKLREKIVEGELEQQLSELDIGKSDGKMGDFGKQQEGEEEDGEEDDSDDDSDDIGNDDNFVDDMINKVTIEEEESDEFNELITLSSSFREMIQKWVKQRMDEHSVNGGSSSAGSTTAASTSVPLQLTDAWLFLSQLSKTYSKDDCDGTISIGRDETLYNPMNRTDKIEFTINPLHLHAIDKMLHFLEQRYNNSPLLHSKVPLLLASDHKIEWEDFQVSYLYQLIVRAMGLHVYYPMELLFHGKVYQYYMYEQRASITDNDTDSTDDSDVNSNHKQYNTLPVYNHRDEIYQCVKDSVLTLISGETGCGKSTVVPMMIYYQGLHDSINNDTTATTATKRPKILMIEPRRIVAKELFERLTNEREKEYLRFLNLQRTSEQGELLEIPTNLRVHLPNIGLRRGLEKPTSCDNNSDSGNNTNRVDITFATAGYVFVKYFHNFNKLLDEGYTHIILDEIHERTLDYDMILFFIKDMLLQARGGSVTTANPTSVEQLSPSLANLKLILMSATPNFELHRSYFQSSPFDPQHRPLLPSEINQVSIIGTTQQLTKYFIDDRYFLDNIIHDMPKSFKDKCRNIEGFGKNIANKLRNADLKGELRPMTKMRNDIFRWQCEVAVDLIEHKCYSTTSSSSSPKVRGVLVFLSGISDIRYLQNRLWSRLKSKIVIEIIHSATEVDSRFQSLEAKSKEDDVATTDKDKRMRVIIATNILESAVTIPDIDVVICFGTQNIQEYDSNNPSRTSLINTWISKPSADQRAGRTGRCNPGIVYRLYPKDLYDIAFPSTVRPEIDSIPLQDVVLKIMDSLLIPPTNDGVINTRRWRNIHDIFNRLPQRLNDQQRINDAVSDLIHLGLLQRDLQTNNDNLQLTKMGRFCCLMRINLRLARIIYFGVLLGVENECSVMVAVLLSDSLPFRKSDSLAVYRHPDNTNNIIRSICNIKLLLDDNKYSDLFMIYTLCLRYKKAYDTDRAAKKKEKQADDASIATTATTTTATPKVSAMQTFWDKHYLDKEKMKRLYERARELMIESQRASKIMNCNLTIEDNPDDKRILPEIIFYPRLDFLTIKSIVLLRIILTWTSGGNILHSAITEDSTVLSVPCNEYEIPSNHIVIKDLPTFNEEKAKELFPSDDKASVKYLMEYAQVTRYAINISGAGSGGVSEFVHSQLLPHLLVPQPPVNGNINDKHESICQIVGVWSNSKKSEVDGSDCVGGYQTLTIYCHVTHDHVITKIQEYFPDIQPTTTDRMNGLICWCKEGTLLDHIRIHDFWNYFESSVEISLPLSDCPNWSMLLYQVNTDSIKQFLTEQGHYECTVYNLNSFWADPTKVNPDNGYSKITFLPTYKSNTSGSVLVDLYPGTRLKNAYCLIRGKQVTIGSCEVYNSDQDMPFDNMEGIPLSVQANNGSWYIASQSKSSTAWDLNSQTWSQCQLQNDSHIAWSNLRIHDYSTNTIRTVYALAGQVTKSEKSKRKVPLPRVIPERNRDYWIQEIAELRKAKADMDESTITNGHSNVVDKNQETTLDEQVITRYRAQYLTILPYTSTWIRVMLSLIERDHSVADSVEEIPLCRNLFLIQTLLVETTLIKANPFLTELLIRFHHSLLNDVVAEWYLVRDILANCHPKICRNFLLFNHCKFGSKCSYSHNLPPDLDRLERLWERTIHVRPKTETIVRSNIGLAKASSPVSPISFVPSSVLKKTVNPGPGQIPKHAPVGHDQVKQPANPAISVVVPPVLTSPPAFAPPVRAPPALVPPALAPLALAPPALIPPPIGAIAIGINPYYDGSPVSPALLAPKGPVLPNIPPNANFAKQPPANHQAVGLHHHGGNKKQSADDTFHNHVDFPALGGKMPAVAPVPPPPLPVVVPVKQPVGGVAKKAPAGGKKGEKEMCYFLLQGKCDKGDKCKFSHVCSFYQKGKCKNGAKCRFKHEG